MIVPRKKASQATGNRSPDFLTLDSASGWPAYDGSTESALRVSAVYRCVAYHSETISIMPHFLMDVATRERVKTHPLLDVLTVRPNEAMSPTELRRLVDALRLLKGKAYAWIRRSSKTGRVEEIIPLNPDFVKIHFDSDRSLHYLYCDPISGKVWDLLPCDLLHYKAFTLNGIEGVSPLTYAREVIEKDKAAKRYERALYQNGGRPSGVLYTDTDLGGKVEEIDESGNKTMVSKKELVRRAWERVHGSGENAFRTAVLDLGLKYQPIAMNNSDAQFVESNDITIADIARFMGVPLHVLMAGKQSYESNVQNRVEFIQTTALAAVTAYEDEDSYKLLSGSDRGRFRVRRDMNAALRADTTARAAYYKTMKEIGAYSPNDILALEDRPNVPGGDVRMASLNFVPLEDFREISRRKKEKK